MKSYIYITLVMLFFKHHVLSYTVDSMPKPTDRGSYIANPDGVLKASTVNELNSLTSLLEKETTVELAVAVVDSIGDEVPKSFVTALFRKWGIGKKDKNNGLLILVVMDQRRFEIEVGYGLEGTVTDAKASQIIRHHMIPTIRKNGVDPAVLIGAKKLSNLVRGENVKDEMIGPTDNEAVNEVFRRAPNILSFIPFIMFGLFIFMFIFMAFIFYRVSKRFSKVSHNLKLKSNMAELEAVMPDLAAMKIHENAKIQGELLKNAKLKEEKKIDLKDFLKSLLNLQKNSLYLVVVLYGICVVLGLFYVMSLQDFIGLIYVFYTIISFAYLYHIFKKQSRSKKISSFVFGESPFIGFSVAELICLSPAVVFIFLARLMLSLQRKYVEKKMEEEGFDFISDENEKEYLSESEVLEEEIGSVEYDIYKNPMIGKIQKITRDIPFSGYVKCSSCSTKAGKLISDEVISHATYSSSGSGIRTYECLFCHEIEKVRYTIPKKTRSSSGRGSSSSSSGGSSFGGGSSGGGGAGGSW